MTDLTLSLAGPVTVRDAHGQDRTPASMKARGLLALLGTAREQRVARARLQDKLWSDRGPEQGAASLRGALAEIRARLGPLRDALTSGPGWVGLDPARVAVALRPPPGVAVGAIEFAEDLSIADPEFADWLLVQRRHFEDLWGRDAAPPAWPAPSPPSPVTPAPTPAPTAEPACLVLMPARTGLDDLDRLADVALREAAGQACDILPVVVLDHRAAGGAGAAAVAATATGGVQDGALVLQVTLTRARTGRQLASRTFRGRAATLAGSMTRITGEIALALLSALSMPDEDGAALGLRLADVFSFAGDRLLRADRALSALPATPEALTLRAYIRNTQYLERLVGDRGGLLGEASDLVAQALELAPSSPTTLAVAALIASQRGDAQLAGDLAGRAVRASPSNPLARSSLSLALAASGRHDEAHAEALRAREAPLAALSPASWAVFCAVTAVRAQRFEEGLRFSLISHGYAPGYRPALRFLAALRHRLGDAEGAAAALRKLRALEPDFSLKLMASGEYPVASLRAAGLLDVTRSGLL